MASPGGPCEIALHVFVSGCRGFRAVVPQAGVTVQLVDSFKPVRQTNLQLAVRQATVGQVAGTKQRILK